MDLSEFRTGAKKKEWQWEPIHPATDGIILGVDQSIANSGYVVVQCYGAEVLLKRAGVFTTAPVATSHEDTLMRGDLLYADFAVLIHQVRPRLIVHEYPPKGGGKMMRPESSLVSAMALRSAAKEAGVPVRIVAAQRMKKRLTGNGNADKPMVKKAIEQRFPFVTELPINNEHTRDAFGLALLACEEPF